MKENVLTRSTSPHRSRDKYHLSRVRCVHSKSRIVLNDFVLVYYYSKKLVEILCRNVAHQNQIRWEPCGWAFVPQPTGHGTCKHQVALINSAPRDVWHQETCGWSGRQCVRVVSWGAVCHTVSRSCFRWKKGWLPDGNYVWVAENHVNSVSTSAHLMIRAAQNASTTGRFSCKFHDSLTRWYPSSSEPFLEDLHVSRWSL